MGRILNLAAFPIAAMAAGCASMQAVASAPITEGVSTAYEAPYKAVASAALQAVISLKLKVEGSDETPQRFQVRFSKPVSAFSWGEVGVINVIRGEGASTRVYVNTEKRDQMQVTGTSEMQFAQQIFTGIRQALPTARP